MMKDDSTFCPLPWVSASTRNNGDYRICCQANVSEGKGILRRSDGTAYNARTDTVDEARNSDLIKDVRKAMLKGEWHSSCVRCFNEEKSSLSSRRMYSQEYLCSHVNFQRAKEHTGSDGSINVTDFPVRDLDLRFGNLCNLKCRMCGPTDSSSWYADQVKMNGLTFQDSHGSVTLRHVGGEHYVPLNNDYDWHESDNFWKNLESLVPSVEHLYIVGGEPLLIKGHFEFLEKIVKGGHAERVVLEYNSNLTLLPERAKKIWPYFKRVRIGASVDGFGEVNEYIRSGSDFKVIESNLDWLDKAEGRFDVWLASTISAYNIHHLPDFMIWKIKKNFKTINSSKAKPYITTHLLHKPSYLNIKVLPKEVKEEIRELFDRKLTEIEAALVGMPQEASKEMLEKAKSLLDKHLHFMESEDRSSEFKLFQNYINRLDSIRSSSFSKIAPWYRKFEG